MRVQRTGQIDVGDERALAGEQGSVLDAADGGSEERHPPNVPSLPGYS